MKSLAELPSYRFVSTQQAPVTAASPAISLFSLATSVRAGGNAERCVSPPRETDSPTHLSPSRAQAEVAKTASDAQLAPLLHFSMTQS